MPIVIARDLKRRRWARRPLYRLLGQVTGRCFNIVLSRIIRHALASASVSDELSL